MKADESWLKADESWWKLMKADESTKCTVRPGSHKEHDISWSLHTISNTATTVTTELLFAGEVYRSLASKSSGTAEQGLCTEACAALGTAQQDVDSNLVESGIF
jgi:hypothetical protein